MGYWTGRIGPFTTGANTIITGLSGAPTGARLTCSGKTTSDTDNHASIGTADGTRQNVQYWSPTSSGSTNTDILWIKDASGTTVLRGSWTSFGTSSGSGTLGMNIATNAAGFQPTLEVWN